MRMIWWFSWKFVPQRVEASQENATKSLCYIQDPCSRSYFEAFSRLSVRQLSIPAPHKFIFLMQCRGSIFTCSKQSRKESCKRTTPFSWDKPSLQTGRRFKQSPALPFIEMLPLSNSSRFFWNQQMWYVKRSPQVYFYSNFAYAGKKNKFRRFGTGIYTTSCSSSEQNFDIYMSVLWHPCRSWWLLRQWCRR